MKIAIDIRALCGTKTGIGKLLENLLAALNKYNAENEITLFFNSLRGEIPDGIPDNNNFIIKRTRVPNRLLNVGWAYINFPPTEYLLGDKDVYYSPNFQAPPAKKMGRVITIHDLVFYTDPELAMPEAVRHYKYRIKTYAERADIITADSYATASEISKHLGINQNRIRVVYPGAIPLKEISNEETESILNKFKLGKYLLFIGCLEPRKNLIRLFKAFEQSKLYKDMTLALAGPRGWRFEVLEAVWNSLKCKDRIRWLNYVSDEELSALYRNAEFFAFPSIAEGFGLPILEAMSAGCPVLTSDRSSMPEVAGNAAYYVDPFEIDSISNGLIKLASDTALRNQISDSGLARFREFSWDKMASELMAIFKEVLDNRAGREES